MKNKLFLLAGICGSMLLSAPAHSAQGWLNWRGPDQMGVSKETGLPDTIRAQDALWSAPFPGASTAVVADGRVYIGGYVGEDGPDLQEGVACFDAETGKELWRATSNDYISDIIYLRYATSSPTVDPATGNVYFQGTQGKLSGFTRDGKELWNVAMMENYGRLTFPNGRTASPVVDQDLVITRGITANWGKDGPAGDRFYAFDKLTGELVWASTPGDRPKDNSFSMPYLGWRKGMRVLYATTGDGSIVCVNARTGQGLWRIPVAKAGINASVLIHNDDKLIAIYGTPYEPGQMIAIKIPDVAPASPTADPVVVNREDVELWSNDLSTSTSSPILVGDKIYVVSEKGSLCQVDVMTGKIEWSLQIGIEQRNSCPLYADGKLYVPILDDPQSKAENQGESGKTGAFYVIKPGKEKGEILSHTALDGNCFGTPAVYNGKIYLQTKARLYAFGKKGPNPSAPKTVVETWPKAGPAAQLQIIPSEVLLHPGESQSFRIRSLDKNGFVVSEKVDPSKVKWVKYIPATARVKAKMEGDFDASGKLAVPAGVGLSAGAFEADYNGIKGYMRGRTLPNFPITEDFNQFNLTEVTTNVFEPATPFAYPPLPWIGARYKFEVREVNGEKALVKTIDNKFFQRGTVFIGDAKMSNYTIQADVMSEGNRRKMSEVGLVCQRYLVVLKGNDQKLEISSNLERLRVPGVTDKSNFKWSPNTWYVLKATVETKPDGSGVVKAKAWPRGEAEPAGWVLEVPHKTAHQEGSPGLFGFSPQEMRVFIDNVKVTKNQ